MRYCARCVTPETRPRIAFDENGVCNACRYADQKKNTKWDEKANELKAIVEPYKLLNNVYDCIIPVSGGKDSHYQIYYVKNILKMNPLCITFMPAIPTDIGNRNRRNMIEKLGVDHITVTPNPQIHRKLCRIMFLEHGNPFIAWIQGIYSVATHVAIEKGIPLIIYGENGEAEYGGASDSEAGKSLDQGGIELRVRSDRHNWKDPANWHQYEIDKKHLIPYIIPLQTEQDMAKIKRMFLGDYIPWNNNRNLFYALNVIGGFNLLERRTVGTYTHGASIDDDIDELYLWFLWVKFGFGRASKSAAPDIREGKLRRDRAIELVRMYDGEFPWYIYDKLLEYMEISEEEFWNTIKKFVGDKDNIEREKQEALNMGIQEKDIPKRIPAWQKIGENKWKHVGTIHGEERTLEIPMKRPDKINLY
jgi:N-acetyl sugar amidotransferase